MDRDSLWGPRQVEPSSAPASATAPSAPVPAAPAPPTIPDQRPGPVVPSLVGRPLPAPPPEAEPAPGSAPTPHARTQAPPASVPIPEWAYGRRHHGIRAGRLLLVLFVLSALVGAAALGYSFLTRPPGARSTFALSLPAGRTLHYRLSLAMQATTTPSLYGTANPAFALDERFTLRVLSVDSSGVATARLTVDEATGHLGSEVVHFHHTSPTTIRITPDGRMLDASVLGLAPADLDGIPFPGTWQTTPLLPSGTAEPGDRWHAAFRQSVPFRSASLWYSASERFLRYETVNGARTAVFLSTLTLPLAFTIDVRALANTEGLGAKAARLPRGKDVTIHVVGTVSMNQTAWFGPATGRWERSTGTGTFSMTVQSKGTDLLAQKVHTVTMHGTATTGLVQMGTA